MFGVFNLDKIYQYLLIALGFLLPLTVYGANLVIVIIVILWFFSGDYKSKYSQIISSRILIASIAFYGLHVIGLLWTEDLKWGLHMLHKMWYFLILYPVLYTIVKREYIKYYVFAFLLAILITEIYSYLIWFELINYDGYRGGNVNSTNPVPFMTHISFNPILAFSIYIVAYELFINKVRSKIELFLYSFFLISMIITMFITSGRAGQVMFFVMIPILIFQYFSAQKIKSLIAVLILLPSIFFGAYQSSDLFKERVDAVIHSAKVFEDSEYSPVNQRITYALNSWEIIKNNVLIGVGTGDFPSQYKKMNKLKSPELFYEYEFSSASQPHNMYTLILVELGIIGLGSMLLIFYYQVRFSLLQSNKFIRDTGVALPLLFLVIMMSDSYLLGHYTTLLFVFFSSFLHKDFEKSS